MTRDVLRRNNTWVMLRKNHREGFRKAYSRWKTWRQILRTVPVQTDITGETEVWLICYLFNYLCAIYSLKSFYRAIA
jgi:hypothetical protein